MGPGVGVCVWVGEQKTLSSCAQPISQATTSSSKAKMAVPGLPHMPSRRAKKKRKASVSCTRSSRKVAPTGNFEKLHTSPREGDFITSLIVQTAGPMPSKTKAVVVSQTLFALLQISNFGSFVTQTAIRPTSYVSPWQCVDGVR